MSNCVTQLFLCVSVFLKHMSEKISSCYVLSRYFFHISFRFYEVIISSFNSSAQFGNKHFRRLQRNSCFFLVFKRYLMSCGILRFFTSVKWSSSSLPLGKTVSPDVKTAQTSCLCLDLYTESSQGWISRLPSQNLHRSQKPNAVWPYTQSAALTGWHGRIPSIWVMMYELPADQRLMKMPAALQCFQFVVLLVRAASIERGMQVLCCIAKQISANVMNHRVIVPFRLKANELNHPPLVSRRLQIN